MSREGWFAPSYGVPSHVKDQIHQWVQSVPWPEGTKLKHPDKYHITSFYSPEGYLDPAHHDWLSQHQTQGFPAMTHSLDSFDSPNPNSGLKPVVMRFHAPELSAHAENLMSEAEQRGLQPSRFEGGHKPHITVAEAPELPQAQPPQIHFQTEPLHELHSYYDSLKRQANILDPIHAGLSPLVFDNPLDERPTLKPHHHRWLMKSIIKTLKDGGYDGMEDWLSLVFTGSLTTYQYSDDSDVDISLFVNTKSFPDWSRAEMIALMVDKMDGTILPGTPHPLQCFVVAPEITKEDLYKPGMRSGYDLETNEWIVPPERDRVKDVQAEMSAQYVHALQQADKMEKLLAFEPGKAVMFWHQIHRRRRKDMQRGKGDYSDSNITYKMLANRKLFPLISEVSGEYIARTSGFPSIHPGNKWQPGTYGKGLVTPQGDIHTWSLRDKVDESDDDDGFADGYPSHHDYANLVGLHPSTDIAAAFGISPGGWYEMYMGGDMADHIEQNTTLYRHPSDEEEWDFYSSFPQISEVSGEYIAKQAAGLQPLPAFDIATEAYQSTVNTGGITIRIDGVVPTMGYAFSPFKGQEKIVPVAQLTEEDLEAYVEEHKQQLVDPVNHLGTWVDGLNAYIDVTQVLTDYDTAYKMAWDADQKAMWDIVQQQEVPVREGGRPPLEIESKILHGASQLAVNLGQPQVAKFVYNIPNNHLVVGSMGREEGEVESHYDLLTRSGLEPKNNVYGQFDPSGRVVTFGRPRIEGFGKPEMNPKEADYRAKQALEATVPGTRFDTFEPGHDKWTLTEPPKVTYMREPPVIGDAEPTSDDWTFSKTAADWQPRPERLEEARKRLGLSLPVRFLPKYDGRGGYGGISRDPMTGNDSHLIYVTTKQNPGARNWAAWHELAHAYQAEHGSEFQPTTGLSDTEYTQLPKEREAEEIANQHADLDLWGE